ncbi:hypothetical protein WOLCODRAFT_15263 [Wolfiporia cocos MD-104 SS10]|uniref:Uncharacterized protein n=1 Tax=Wolfiporia cocos (strain MD-104) TaxID=742152 RepID=A0A2H3J9J1_WOLCO|nr:hypothetical protein WOLCODRAFT_15263 [Wolfiporia cocos MD-104 SS10]
MAFPACNSIYVDPKTLPRGIAFVETSAPNNAQNPPSGLQIPQYTGREYDAADALIYLTRSGAKQVSADALNVRTARTPKPAAPKRTFLVVEPSDRATRSMTWTEVPAGQTATADIVKNHRSTQSRGEAHLTTAAHRGEGPCTAEIPCGQEAYSGEITPCTAHQSGQEWQDQNEQVQKKQKQKQRSRTRSTRM